MISDDYALALRLQEEFDRESAVHISERESNNDRGSWSDWTHTADVSHRARNQPATSSVIDPTWELVDPSPDARALFVEFNEKYFWGKLASVEVRWSPRMTLCAGVCVYEGRGGMCSIRLSLPLLKLRPRKDLVETLLHEMIHAFLFVTNNDRDRDGHGPEFLKHMNRLNQATGARITVYHSFHDEVDSYRTHWWRCNGRCQNRKPFFGYVKRAMNRPPSHNDPWFSEHTQTCGGTFIKIKEPEGFGAKKSKKSQDQKESGANDKASGSALVNWLHTTTSESSTSTVSNSAASVGSHGVISSSKSSEGASLMTSEVSDADYLSDDELVAAVGSLQQYFGEPPLMIDSKGHPPRDGKTESSSTNIAGKQVGAGHKETDGILSSSAKNHQTGSGDLRFPGSGKVLGQWALSGETPGSSSSRQIVRRLPGIGEIEVPVGDRTAQPRMVPAGESVPKKPNVTGKNSDKTEIGLNAGDYVSRVDHSDHASGHFNSTDKDTSGKGKGIPESHASNRRSPPFPRSPNNKVDIRFWLSDSSRKVGEVVRVPHFTSVCNSEFRNSKKRTENKVPAMKIPRSSTCDGAGPAKKMRLDDGKSSVISNAMIDKKSSMITGDHWLQKKDNDPTKNVNNIGGKNNSNKNVEHGIGKREEHDPQKSTGFGAVSAVDFNSDTKMDRSKGKSSESDHGKDADFIVLPSDDDSDVGESKTIASVLHGIKQSLSVSSAAEGRSSREEARPKEEFQFIETVQRPDSPGLGLGRNASLDTDGRSTPDCAPCPACGTLIKIISINEHLDLCLL